MKRKIIRKRIGIDHDDRIEPETIDSPVESDAPDEKDMPKSKKAPSKKRRKKSIQKTTLF